MAMHAHIEDYLDDYIANGDVDSAVMLDGEWGSGKTYFVEDYLKRKWRDGKKKPQWVYVSLNGIRDVASINRAILKNLHHFWCGDLMRKAVKCGAVLANAIANISAEDSMGAFDAAQSLLSIKAKLIVFDDLERCLMPVIEVFGYAAGLLKDGVHVLFVGSEKELLKLAEQGSVPYESIKEKVIGKTFVIPENVEAVIDVFLKDAKLGCVFDTLKCVKNDLIDGFRAVPDKYNYRAYKHALRNFNYWACHFPKIVLENRSFMRDFARAFVPLSYERHLGNLTRSNFGQRHLYGSEHAELTEYEKILNRHRLTFHYLFDTVPHVVISEDVLGRMLFSERVSFDEINAAILATKYFESAKRLTEWQKLMRWDVREDEEVSDLIRVIETKLRKAEYVVPEEILHVYCVLCHLSEYGVVKKSIEEIVKGAAAYVARLCKSHALCPISDSEYGEVLRRGWGGYGYVGEFDSKPWFVAIRDIVISECAKSEDEEIGNWIRANCPGGIDGNTNEFIQRISRGVWSDRPLFHYVDSARFIKTYCSLQNSGKRELGELLNSRYSRCGSNVLEVEKPFWIAVCKKLKKTAVPQTGCAAKTPSGLQICILYNLINEKWALGYPKAKIMRSIEEVKI